MNKDILLVVGSSTLASVMSQHLMNVDMCAFHASVMNTGYRLIVVCDPLTDPQVQSWFDASIATRLEKGGQIAYVEHPIGVLANAPQAQVRKDYAAPMPIEPLEIVLERPEAPAPMPAPVDIDPVPSGQAPAEPVTITQLVQPLPVHMPVLDESGKIVTDIDVINAAHVAPEQDHGN